MIDLYATVARDPARRLVNTHHNGDHCWGNQLFADLGTEIIGHRLCAEWFGRDATPELFVGLAAADHVPAAFEALAAAMRDFDFTGIELTPPTTLIDDRHRARPRRPGRSAALRRSGAHPWRRRRPPARARCGVHRRHPLPPVHADRLGGHLRQLDRRAGSARGSRAHRSSCRDTGRSPPSTACATSGSTSPTCATRPGPGSRPDSAPSRPPAASTSVRTGSWTEPERLAFQVDRAYRELSGTPGTRPSTPTASSARWPPSAPSTPLPDATPETGHLCPSD